MLIAILGAGELGATLARLIAGRDLVPRVMLIDDAGEVAAGVALDILQAGAVARFSTQVTGTNDAGAAATATLAVIADRAGHGEWQGDAGLGLLKRLHRVAGGVPIVCGGSSQRDLVERGVRELGISRQRIIGTAPEALASALRSLVALEADGSPADVALTVLGVPPDHIVVPWEEATIGGLELVKRLDPPALRRLERRAKEIWPPGPLALAAAAGKAVEALLERTRHAVSGFTAPDDAAGRRARAAAFPLRLGRDGIVAIEQPQLNPHDRIALENAILL
jgi:malate dehydrogenase